MTEANVPAMKASQALGVDEWRKGYSAAEDFASEHAEDDSLHRTTQLNSNRLLDFLNPSPLLLLSSIETSLNPDFPHFEPCCGSIAFTGSLDDGLDASRRRNEIFGRYCGLLRRPSLQSKSKCWTHAAR